MTVITEPPPVAESSVQDRRRPGRLQQVSPELIPLLRQSERDTISVENLDIETDDDDQLSASRGVMSGLALSIPMWVGFAYFLRWVMG